MCIMKAPPAAKTVTAPAKEVTVSNEDAVATALAQEKKRKGYSSTDVTGGALDTAAVTQKKTLFGV